MKSICEMIKVKTWKDRRKDILPVSRLLHQQQQRVHLQTEQVFLQEVSYLAFGKHQN